MIDLIQGLPGGVVGLEAVGEVTAEDYEAVASELKRAREGHEKVRLLHVIGDRYTDTSIGGMREDVKLLLAHLTSLERVAVVTDLEYLRLMVKGAGWSVPGEMKLFTNAERAEAEAWVSEGLEPGGSTTASRAASDLRSGSKGSETLRAEHDESD